MTLAPGEDSTTEVRAGFGFDEAALGRWMREHVAGFEGPFSVRQFQGGQSNPTFRVTTGAASYVLRRKPPGPLLPGAHAIERAARVLARPATADFPGPNSPGPRHDYAVLGDRK